jgi:hypothetical protein
MSAFEDDLKAMFAADAGEPDDAGFSDAVARRVRRRERWAFALEHGRFAGYAMAAGAVLYAGVDVAERLAPRAWLKPAVLVHAISAPAALVGGLAPLAIAAGIAAVAVTYARARD